jgi:hypothetical protein
MTQHLTPFEQKLQKIAEDAERRGLVQRRDDRQLPIIEYKFPPAPTACQTEGHEYDFGICLDCDHVDPAFEPTDGQIPGTYEIQQAAA